MDATFDRAFDLLFQEEHTLRTQAEQEVRAYARLVYDLARELIPAELDRRQHADPTAVAILTPDAWRKLLHYVLAGDTGTRHGDDRAAAAALAGAQKTIRELEERIQVLEAALAAGNRGQEAGDSSQEAGGSGQRTGDREQERRFEAGNKALEQPDKSSDACCLTPDALSLPALPNQPPASYAKAFAGRAWERQALLLATLAVTGWSMRLGIAEAVAARLGNVSASAGSFQRAMKALEELGFWQTGRARVSFGQTRRGRASQVVLVRLTVQGRKLAQAIGVTPVLSEWEMLEIRHGGPEQIGHVGLVCTFAYHARLRGYGTTVCPEAPPAADPDVALHRAGETVYVVVETESGSAERRTKRWHNQIAWQGRVALFTLTPEMQARLVAEAKAAGARHGRATNLQHLFEGQKERGVLWAHEW